MLCLSAFFQICRTLVILSLEATILCDVCQSYIHTRTHTNTCTFFYFEQNQSLLRIPFMKWMVVISALSDIWDTVNYHCVKYSHRCVSSATVQYGIYTINLLHKALTSLIGAELTSVPIYQKAFLSHDRRSFHVKFQILTRFYFCVLHKIFLHAIYHF